MALTPKQKEKATESFKRHKKDTGSPEYQISLLTEKIKKLTKHLKGNKKDIHSRRGLLKMVATRKRLLSYLKDRNPRKHKKLTGELKIK